MTHYSDKLLPIDRLYEENAEAYSAIALDRDFSAENSEIYRLARREAAFLQNDSALLELFAGPAWHSCHWSRAYGGRVIAIDSSEPMRQIAWRSGHVKCEDYLIARLPELPNWPLNSGRSPRFSVVLALRYSIGYLNKSELITLLVKLRSVIAPGGVFVIELHDPGLLNTDFDSLAIRTRTASLRDGTIVECRWPAGPIKWDDDRYLAGMPVQISVRPSRDEVTEYIDFVSIEHAYRTAHIEQMCQSAGGGYSLEDWTSEVVSVFSSSVVLALRRN